MSSAIGKETWKLRRSELLEEAERLGVRDPEKYTVRELKMVVGARRRPH